MKTTDKSSQLRILIAEDNSAVREFIVRALAVFKAEIQTACDGQEALTALTESTFEVLITDIMMPNIDGITLALKVGQDYPSMRVIMISGYAQERMRAHNLDSLVHRIIAKPFSLDEICDAVEDVLALNTVKR